MAQKCCHSSYNRYLFNLFYSSFLKCCLIVSSTIAIITTNILFIIILNKETYKEWIKPQPRIILTALALNDLANGLIVLGLGLFPAVFECWPYGELTCQIQVILFSYNR